MLHILGYVAIVLLVWMCIAIWTFFELVGFPPPKWTENEKLVLVATFPLNILLRITVRE